MATAAEIYAQTQADALKQQLQTYFDQYNQSFVDRQNSLNAIAQQNLKDLLDAFNKERDYLQGSYNSQKDYLLGAHNAQKDELQNQANIAIGTATDDYQDSARQAYVNKVLSGDVLQNQLNRLNLNTGGFGIGQMVDISNQYSENLGGLQEALADAKTDIQNNLNSNLFKADQAFNNDMFNMNQKFNDTMFDLQSGYDSNVNKINQGLSIDLLNLNTERDQTLMKLQQNIDSQIADAYNTALKNYKSLYGGSGGSGGYRGSKRSGSTDFLGNSAETQKKSDYYWKKADGSYTDQPSYVYNKRLTNTGKKVKNMYSDQKNTSFGNHKIWRGIDQQGNRAFYVWDTKINDYVDITDDYVKYYEKGFAGPLVW